MLLEDAHLTRAHVTDEYAEAFATKNEFGNYTLRRRSDGEVIGKFSSVALMESWMTANGWSTE